MHLSHIMRLVQTKIKFNCFPKNLSQIKKIFDIVVKVTEAGEALSKSNLSMGSPYIYYFQIWLTKNDFIHFQYIYPFCTPKYNLEPHL